MNLSSPCRWLSSGSSRGSWRRWNLQCSCALDHLASDLRPEAIGLDVSRNLLSLHRNRDIFNNSFASSFVSSGCPWPAGPRSSRSPESALRILATGKFYLWHGANIRVISVEGHVARVRATRADVEVPGAGTHCSLLRSSTDL